MDSVAIVGAGFAGMAACYLLSKAGYHVCLYDEVGIGGGASGVSPGLLHPYPGRFPTRKTELFEKALELVGVTGREAVRSRGIIRVATGPAQGLYFRKMARRDGDVKIWKGETLRTPYGAILITSGITLNTRAYLEGLWEASLQLGAEFVKERVEGRPAADRVVYATGAASPVEVKRIKGQVLILEWPKAVAPLPHSVIGKKYLVMEGETCVVGATFDTSGFDLERAKRELLPPAVALCPALKGARVLGVRSGVRAKLPQPRVVELGDQSWAIAGLGSKGLLTHARLAQNLVELWRN